MPLYRCRSLSLSALSKKVRRSMRLEIGKKQKSQFILGFRSKKLGESNRSFPFLQKKTQAHQNLRFCHPNTQEHLTTPTTTELKKVNERGYFHPHRPSRRPNRCVCLCSLFYFSFFFLASVACVMRDSRLVSVDFFFCSWLTFSLLPGPLRKRTTQVTRAGSFTA